MDRALGRMFVGIVTFLAWSIVIVYLGFGVIFPAALSFLNVHILPPLPSIARKVSSTVRELIPEPPILYTTEQEAPVQAEPVRTSPQPPAPRSQPVQGIITTQGACSGTRQATGVGQTMPFNAGDCVAGGTVVVAGRTMQPQPCFLANAPAGGTVTTGVKFPWPGREREYPPCR